MGILNLLQQAAPSTPPANVNVVYFKSDGLMYWKDPSGTEYKVEYQGSLGDVNPLTGVAGTNTVTASGNPTIAALQAGQVSVWIPAVTNTAGVILQIDATAAKSVLKKGASGLVALAAGDLVAGCYAITIYDGTQYNLINPAPTAAGTDGYKLTGTGSSSLFLPPDQGFSLINGYLDWTVASNNLTVAVKTWAGADPSATDPVYAVLRDPTATTGLPVLIKITAANSVVVSSGSTLGTRSTIPCRVWAVLFNDAGTYRLGVINCLTTVAGAGVGSDVTAIYPLSGWGIASSTLVGATSNSAQTFYTAGAGVTSKAYSVLGYATFESGQTTAGTWATAASRKQLWGPSVPLPGQVIQIQNTQTGAVATGTTTVTFGDTIPPNTAGDQYMSQAIIPVSAANALEINTQCVVGNDAAGASSMIISLYQDSTANALASSTFTQAAASHRSTNGIRYILLSGVTVSTTFKIRAGSSSAGTTTFNGSAGTRVFGGVANSFLRITELMG